MALSEFYEKNSEFRHTVGRNFKYPLLIITGSIGIIAAMLTWFIPPAVHILSGLRISLPPLSREVFIWSCRLCNHWETAALVFALLFAAALWSIRYANTLLRWAAQLSVRVRLFEKMGRKILLRRFSLAFSLLLSVGADAAEALAGAAQTAGFSLHNRRRGPPMGNTSPQNADPVARDLKNRPFSPGRSAKRSTMRSTVQMPANCLKK